ncbi:MAG: hypothetical protein ABW275_09375 [Hansschlegelia sp.]
MDVGSIEAGEDCPIPADVLMMLYRSKAEVAVDLARTLPNHVRARLALHCYSRAHLRPLGLAIAESCSPGDLERLAGVTGRVLAEQSVGRDRRFGMHEARSSSKAPISLAKSAA